MNTTHGDVGVSQSTPDNTQPTGNTPLDTMAAQPEWAELSLAERLQLLLIAEMDEMDIGRQPEGSPE